MKGQLVVCTVTRPHDGNQLGVKGDGLCEGREK